MKIVLMILSSILATISDAQKRMPESDSLLVGTWKGTSICQVRPSACKDEIAVYHISRSDSSTYHIVMNKVVNEKEEDMSAGDYAFDANKKTLTYWDEQHKIVWTFHVIGDRMEGTLVYQNKIYRIIKLNKSLSN